jgi:fructose-1,6-bisphosphatase/inositol monophosphatase family enzyme
VYSPEFERMYCATSDGASTLNGREIHCSTQDTLEKSTICLEVPSRESPRSQLSAGLGRMSLLIEKAHRVRIIGVGSLGLCFCASGGFDAYINLGSMRKQHDVAAGEIIVREAGGEFHRAGKYIVAGPTVLCDQIRATLEI